jgi:hypothetical protein
MRLFALSLLAPSAAKTHADLVTLFTGWRALRSPRLVAGVPDDGPAAVDAQRRALPAWQARFEELAPSGWPVSQQVDKYLVRAEMNGLDFGHRVPRPWELTGQSEAVPAARRR